MKSSILIGLLLLFGAAMQASAQFAPPSGGETAALLKCFYECKEGPLVGGVSTFAEITTLMLTNQSPDLRFADVYYFDGKEQCVAHSGIELSSLDLDELNVCHSLLFGGVIPPPAGLVEIVVSDPAVPGTPGDGVYAWGKNVIGKFRHDRPEPFEGRVTGVGKYECRLVPDEVGAQQALAASCQAPVEVDPILVEETDDACSCDGDLDDDGIVTVADFGILDACIGMPPTGACAAADINCDGVIDDADLSVWKCQIGAPPDPACCS